VTASLVAGDVVAAIGAGTGLVFMGVHSSKEGRYPLWAAPGMGDFFYLNS